jgi:cell division protein FtsB
MSPAQPKSNTVLDKFKLWLFPVLVSILATVIYREVLEIRSDVKQLLAQSNVDKTKIEILEQQVKSLNDAVFMQGKSTSSRPINDEKNPIWEFRNSMLLVKPEEKYYTVNDRIVKK